MVSHAQPAQQSGVHPPVVRHRRDRRTILISSTGVFWLPAYHDMGLIGGILTPLYMGGRSVLMSPTAFLQRPMRWLQAIHDYQAIDQRCAEFRVRVLRAPHDGRGAGRARFEPLAAGVLRRGADSRRDAAAFCRGVRAGRVSAWRRFIRATAWPRRRCWRRGPIIARSRAILAVNRAALAEHRVVPACGEPAADDAAARRLRAGGRRITRSSSSIRKRAIECADGEVGEILDSRSVGHAGLLEPPGGNRAGVRCARRRARRPIPADRRPGFLPRRRAVRHRPREGRDHHPRPQSLSAGHRAIGRGGPSGRAARCRVRAGG